MKILKRISLIAAAPALTLALTAAAGSTPAPAPPQPPPTAPAPGSIQPPPASYTPAPPAGLHQWPESGPQGPSLLPPSSPGAAASSGFSNETICEEADGHCVYDHNPGRSGALETNTYNGDSRFRWTAITVGTVSSSGCWPFTCGSGLNAQYNGYTVYHLQSAYDGGCWGVTTGNAMYDGSICDSSQWKLGNDWVAGPAPDGQSGWYDLINVVVSSGYNQTMNAQSWGGSGTQMSVNYWSNSTYRLNQSFANFT